MEALLLQQTHHPCIVRVLGAGLAPPLPFLVLEEMPRCLADIILDTTQPLFLAQVIKISFDLASALEYLHPGILHRDIK